MHYSIIHGVYNSLHERLAQLGGVGLPTMAIAFLAVALFSFSTYEAFGAHPHISPPPQPTKTSLSSTAPTAAAPPYHQPTAPAAASQQPAVVSPTPTQTVQTPTVISSGLDGSGVPGTTTTTSQPVSSTSVSGTGTSADTTSGGVTTPTGSGSNALQTTVTVPGVDLQAGSKTVLQSSPTTLTIN